MFRDYGDRVAFLMVYIHEAHADDEWQMDANREEQVVYKQPTTLEERESIARACCSSLKLTLPCVVDTPDNRVDAAYAAWPERLFVVDAGGRIAYASGQGPYGYKPEELERWLRKNVGGPGKGRSLAGASCARPNGYVERGLFDENGRCWGLCPQTPGVYALNQEKGP